jgi:hypothetical protein
VEAREFRKFARKLSTIDASPSGIHRRFIASYYYAALQGEERKPRKPSEKRKPVVSRAQNPRASS